MQTQFEPGSYEQNFVDSAIQLLLPVLEKSMILAADYSKACDRDFVTSWDLKYAMRYCAQHVLGRIQGSLFPEIYEEDSDSDEDEDALDIVQENEDSFTRYTGDNVFYLRMNEAFDDWDNWEPQSPIETMLKDAIDNQN
jgi:hypothetical protein